MRSPLSRVRVDAPLASWLGSEARVEPAQRDCPAGDHVELAGAGSAPHDPPTPYFQGSQVRAKLAVGSFLRSLRAPVLLLCPFPFLWCLLSVRVLARGLGPALHRAPYLATLALRMM